MTFFDTIMVADQVTIAIGKNNSTARSMTGMKQKMIFLFLLTTLSCVFTFSRLSAGNNGITNHPLFTNFIYQGEDPVYENYPLEADEFYNPILQGCYPDPSI